MLEFLIAWLLIGAIAGWLASLIVKGHGLGLVGNIVVGIVGAVIAGWLLPLIGFVFLGASSRRHKRGYRCRTSSGHHRICSTEDCLEHCNFPAIELFIGRCQA